jgi:adenylate cyclase
MMTEMGDLPLDLDTQSLHQLSKDELLQLVQQQQQTILSLRRDLQQLHHPANLSAHALLPIDAPEPNNAGDVAEHRGMAATPEEAKEVNLEVDPYLIVKTEGQSYTFPLTGGSCWTIGRSEDNAVVLPDCWLSRNHAMLQSMGPGEFYLIDLGSRNGTFVNGRRVNVPVALQDGDRLVFGQTEIEFYGGDLMMTALFTSPSMGNRGEQASATALLQVRRLISVLVVDIRNFTILTRNINEEILSEAMGTWFQRAGDIIREQGSWVDKYIGDAVMAVWIHDAQEIPDAEMKQIFQSLRALNAMTSQLHLHYPLPFQLQIGAGLNTGYAMVGNAGSGNRPEYTALGDTVNTAFRLETSTKQLQTDIALGITTYQYLPPRERQNLPFTKQIVHLKGYEVAVPTYTGTFADLDTFLEIGTKVDDTLY